MVSEARITTFLNLQQLVLDTEDNSRLLADFLPKALDQLNLLGSGYIFLSAIFIDEQGATKQTFFTQQNKSTGAQSPIDNSNIFQKGSEWEMKVLYGDAAVVSDIAYFINPQYENFGQIHSLLILPIQHLGKLSGILVLASSKRADKVDAEEIEFGKMITRLANLAYRLQDTESSLTTITQQVYQMNAKLHQLDKLKDDFVSIASHELRTPMTAIRSYVWMALNRSDIPLSEKMHRYLDRTLISTERLINLVNDMLNVSRIEAGSIEINPAPFDMVTLIKDVFDEVKIKADEKQVSLSVLEYPVPQVFADANKVHEILLNLIGNSIKFSFPSGSIRVGFFIDKELLEISVIDTGPGISKEDLGKLFGKFNRLDSSYAAVSTSGGTGLGLYISKSLVELMHGKIWADSAGVNKGATFSFSLPIATKEILANAEKYRFKPVGEVKGLEPVAI